MAKGPWTTAARARNHFADLVEPLSDEQFATKTLCGDWTVHHVLAHLVFIVEMKAFRMFLDMAKAGFDYDKMADRKAQAIADSATPAELIARLRAGASNAAPMPGFEEILPIGDATIHAQDVRRALDLDGAPDADLLQMALDFVTTNKIGMALSDVGEGMRFEATDLDWAQGEGPVVTGPGEAILMTLAGRVTGELDGL